MSAPDLAICADRDHDWYCTKAHGHLGEHATITVSGVTRHRWTQTTPGDAVKDAAPASSGAPSEPDWAAVAESLASLADLLASLAEGAVRTTDAMRSAWSAAEEAIEALHDAYKAVQS
jgi:hypothetical protein